MQSTTGTVQFHVNKAHAAQPSILLSVDQTSDKRGTRCSIGKYREFVAPCPPPVSYVGKMRIETGASATTVRTRCLDSAIAALDVV